MLFDRMYVCRVGSLFVVIFWKPEPTKHWAMMFLRFLFSFLILARTPQNTRAAHGPRHPEYADTALLNKLFIHTYTHIHKYIHRYEHVDLLSILCVSVSKNVCVCVCVCGCQFNLRLCVRVIWFVFVCGGFGGLLICVWGSVQLPWESVTPWPPKKRSRPWLLGPFWSGRWRP